MIRIGIICPSEIAFRRFLPALKKRKEYQYIGVAIASKEDWFGPKYEEVEDEIYEKVKKTELEKAEKFSSEYGGKIFQSYSDLIASSDIDAVYVPLPPALHFRWAKKALENNKHVFVEKPSTTSSEDTCTLISLAKERKLALHENYMFAFHDQLKEIQNIVDSGRIGDVRLYRIDFGFPRRAQNDFRYSPALGGGALLDCGGYTLKYASMLLGETTKIEYARLNYTDEFKVDLYGSAALSNDKGQIVQVSFGMDNAYKCDLEVWGSRGRILTGRVLTAPAGFVPTYTLIDQDGREEHELPADDTFLKSLQYFARCIEDENTRYESWKKIQRQADLVSEFVKKSN